MSASARVNDLAQRKRLLVLQAELHRQIIEIERIRLFDRVDFLRGRLLANRWWLLGSVAAAGWLSTRKFGRLLRFLPMGMTAWRLLQNFKPRDFNK